jgi:hypothetical protein
LAQPTARALRSHGPSTAAAQLQSGRGTDCRSQRPAHHDGSIDRFCLANCAPMHMPVSPETRGAARAWKEMKISSDIEELEAFRNQYGKTNPWCDTRAASRIVDLAQSAKNDAPATAYARIRRRADDLPNGPKRKTREPLKLMRPICSRTPPEILRQLASQSAWATAS